MCIVSSDFDGARQRTYSEYFHLCAGPPRHISFSLHLARYRHASRIWLTGIIHTQNFSFLIGERVSIILVQGATTIRARIYAKLQWSMRDLSGVLDEFLH